MAQSSSLTSWLYNVGAKTIAFVKPSEPNKDTKRINHTVARRNREIERCKRIVRQYNEAHGCVDIWDEEDKTTEEEDRADASMYAHLAAALNVSDNITEDTSEEHMKMLEKQRVASERTTSERNANVRRVRKDIDIYDDANASVNKDAIRLGAQDDVDNPLDLIEKAPYSGTGNCYDNMDVSAITPEGNQEQRLYAKRMRDLLNKTAERVKERNASLMDHIKEYDTTNDITYTFGGNHCSDTDDIDEEERESLYKAPNYKTFTDDDGMKYIAIVNNDDVVIDDVINKHTNYDNIFMPDVYRTGYYSM